jgi:hypothetical protein
MPPAILLSEFVAALQFGDATAGEKSHPTPGDEPLPVVTDREELAFARQFAAAVNNPGDRQRLELALASGNAHEAFEMTVFRCQIANEWFQFRDRCVVRFARDWLDARGLIYTDDVSLPAD